MTYRELLDKFEESFKEKILQLDATKVKEYLPFITFKDKVFNVLNPSTYSMKNLLLSQETHIAFCHILTTFDNKKLYYDHKTKFISYNVDELTIQQHKVKKQNSSNSSDSTSSSSLDEDIVSMSSSKGKPKLNKINVIFSPMKKINEEDLSVLADVCDYYNNKYIDIEIGLEKFANLKEKKFYTTLFNKQEDPRFYHLNDDENHLLDDKIIYLSSVLYNSYNINPMIFKQLYIPIIYNQNISKQVMFLPFEFYPEDIKKILIESEKVIDLGKMEEEEEVKKISEPEVKEDLKTE